MSSRTGIIRRLIVYDIVFSLTDTGSQGQEPRADTLQAMFDHACNRICDATVPCAMRIERLGGARLRTREGRDFVARIHERAHRSMLRLR